MPVPLVKRGSVWKERERNKDGSWKKKRRSDTGKTRLVQPSERDKILEYYETLPGKLSLRLNDPDLGLMEDDKRDFVKPVEALMDEVKALDRQIAILMRDNGELRIKLKAHEREAELIKSVTCEALK